MEKQNEALTSIHFQDLHNVYRVEHGEHAGQEGSIRLADSLVALKQCDVTDDRRTYARQVREFFASLLPILNSTTAGDEGSLDLLERKYWYWARQNEGVNSPVLGFGRKPKDDEGNGIRSSLRDHSIDENQRDYILRQIFLAVEDFLYQEENNFNGNGYQHSEKSPFFILEPLELFHKALGIYSGVEIQLETGNFKSTPWEAASAKLRKNPDKNLWITYARCIIELLETKSTKLGEGEDTLLLEELKAIPIMVSGSPLVRTMVFERIEEEKIRLAIAVAKRKTESGSDPVFEKLVKLIATDKLTQDIYERLLAIPNNETQTLVARAVCDSFTHSLREMRRNDFITEEREETVMMELRAILRMKFPIWYADPIFHGSTVWSALRTEFELSSSIPVRE